MESPAAIGYASSGRDQRPGSKPAAKQEWTALLGRALRIEVPDDRVRQAFYASLGDFFIMRDRCSGHQDFGAD